MMNISRILSETKRFVVLKWIDVPEPTVDECTKILYGIRKKFENYHHVIYTDDAINFSVIGSAKYITGRSLPDKAIDLLDDVGA